MSQQLQLLCRFFLLGICISFFYDCLRILRRVFPRGMVCVSLEDIAYVVAVSFRAFLLLVQEGQGRIRWFLILGTGLGMFLYGKLVSRRYVAISALFLKMLKNKLTAFFKLAKIDLQTVFRKTRKE